MMKKHPEYLILIAVLVAMVVAVACLASSCSAFSSAVVSSLPGNGGQIIEEIIGDGGNGNGDAGNGGGSGQTPGQNGGYGEDDVPESMDIETDELSSDLETCINYDITSKLGLSDSDKVTVSDLTKDEVSQPMLRNGYVAAQVSGKVTVTNMLGRSQTVDYTSYYYADDPTAEKITWYIYAYDLSSYDVMPDGLEAVAGDPTGLRGTILGDAASYSGGALPGGMDARSA